ncbi:MAG: ATP-binding protein [Ignavibacteriae bacterium]|nr:ATP-binding protein [Ignavibacteriota bacterium]
MTYHRPQFKILKKRLKEKRQFIQTVVGPRQVGKTTLVLQLLDELDYLSYYHSADAIDSSNSLWLVQQWESARLKLKTSKANQCILVIDEIQKISNWSEIVKAEWDKDTIDKVKIKVIVLGSSSLLIQKGLTESLAGRYEKIYLGHWSYSEMKNAFNLEVNKFVWFGGYPGAVTLIEDENRWKDYIKNSLIETTVSKDILMMQRIDKPALLKRLFELGCLYSGQILSYTKMLGQLQDVGNTVTLSHYLDLLNTAGLIKGLEKFSIQKVRQRGSSPKFQVYNTAFLSGQMVENFEEIKMQPEKWGRIVESAIGAHLINYSLTEEFNVYYWRHKGNEVDFVLERNGKIIGLEIKSGLQQYSKGLENFNKDFSAEKVMLIGKSGFPWEDFLDINPVELF